MCGYDFREGQGSITWKGLDMKPSRFMEEQIIGILREQEAGAKTADVCRKHGISSATFYKWKAKYGGLDVSDAERLKTLEDENGALAAMTAWGHPGAIRPRLVHGSSTFSCGRTRAQGRRVTQPFGYPRTGTCERIT
jgi:putative transposase